MWGNHSFGRHADELAQRALREGLPGMKGVTIDLINAYFGWCLRELIPTWRWSISKFSKSFIHEHARATRSFSLQVVPPLDLLGGSRE